MAEAYITDQLDAKYQSAHRAGDWLSDRIQELKQQTTSADKSIVDFKSENNIVDANGRSVSEQQVAELNTQVLSARTATTEARARLDRIQQIMKSDVRGATVTDTLRSDVVSKLRSQYLDLANREADLSGRYGSGHLAAVNLRNQMQEIAASIKAELSRLAETYKSDYEISKQREDEAQRALDDAVARSQVKGQAQVQLKQLESNSQIYRTLYESFLKRYAESVQQQSFPITEARVISVATRPDKRSSPRTVLVLILACGGGLMLGVGIATMRDLADRTIRTSDQAEALLGTDCLAILPALIADASQDNESPPGQPRTIRRNAGVFWTVANDPFSHYTEGVRAIKLAIDLSNQARSGRVVGLSSALPSEGKSTVAAALALLCTQAGASSILVDGDLRNPALTRLMAPNADKGLIEMIHGTAKLEEVICKDDASGLHFLPVVTSSPLPYSCEILASDPMRILIENLSKQYDYVIVDLSPMAPIIDVRSTGHFIPTYLLVVEWGKTNIEVLGRALASAPNVRGKLLGVVLNKADTSLLKRHEGYDGSYYHHPKYSQGVQSS
jgi:succinoglycan biosynthesis transport protein ExoP